MKAAPRKKTSSDNLTARKPEPRKCPRSRSPLKDLNGGGGGCGGDAGSSLSNAPESGGSCLKATSIARSKSLPKVPRSAPPSATPFNSKNRSIPSKLHRTLSSRNPARSDLLSLSGLGSKDLKNPRNHSQHGRDVKKQSTKLQSGRRFATEWKEEVPASTPERISNCLAPAANAPWVHRGDSSPKWKEGCWRQLSNTPSSSATPPIQASISPEIAGGTSSMSSATTCFGTGHLIAGVRDRRKCRPRGILTVRGNASETSGARPRESLVSPPLADASIRWLSPIPIHDGEDENAGGHFEIGSLNQWKVHTSYNEFLSPDKIIANESLSSHSLGFDQVASASESSTSAFFAIICQAESAAAESSPLSVLKNLQLSSEDGKKEMKTMLKNPSDWKDESFQFQLHSPPSSSIDLTHFQNHQSGSDDGQFSFEESVSSISQMRISWREGLESRIFNMGEMVLGEAANGESVFDSKHDRQHKSSGEFASEEFLREHLRVHENRDKGSESICLEDAGLFSSGDSERSFFYKNHLFEG